MHASNEISPRCMCAIREYENMLHHVDLLSFSYIQYTSKIGRCLNTTWDPVCKVSGNLNNSSFSKV